MDGDWGQGPIPSFFSIFIETSTILGQEVAERLLEDVHVRAGYILSISFVLLIQKYFILFYLLYYFILFHFILFYCQNPDLTSTQGWV